MAVLLVNREREKIDLLTDASIGAIFAGVLLVLMGLVVMFDPLLPPIPEWSRWLMGAGMLMVGVGVAQASVQALR